MRFFLMISAMGLLSFGTKTSKVPEDLKSVWGNWRGSYGTTVTITDISIYLTPRNTIELSGTNINEQIKGAGSYKIIGDTGIIITCHFLNNNRETITMKGRMNKTKTFVDGEWEMMGSRNKGSFYLQRNTIAKN
ncbi:MAG: hypothetical protein ACM3H8_14325 [Sphingobacteriales bacterium]